MTSITKTKTISPPKIANINPKLNDLKEIDLHLDSTSTSNKPLFLKRAETSLVKVCKMDADKKDSSLIWLSKQVYQLKF